MKRHAEKVNEKESIGDCSRLCATRLCFAFGFQSNEEKNKKKKKEEERRKLVEEINVRLFLFRVAFFFPH